ncbi:ribonuclease H-like domain-containing protein [Candidatus Woesearchaeota archaeon]|nr:ribonuclease H-like domain-containing protein [Candidatus Woesearchaeota archaeon]
MIQNSFIFLDKISEKKEKLLWQQGITNWNRFLEAEEINGISKSRKTFYDIQLRRAKTALKEMHSSFFINKLPSDENWRLYDHFKDQCCFLDIETNGVGPGSYLTLIGLFDGYETKTMIQGINFDAKQLMKELSKYKLIVTFNGATFDIPFLKKRYPKLLPDIPNLDLKSACTKIGLKGGLKHIEKKLGIERKNKIVHGMNGGDAYRLWRMYRASGNKYYLKILIEYNEEDCINLKWIADYAVKKLRQNSF